MNLGLMLVECDSVHNDQLFERVTVGMLNGINVGMLNTVGMLNGISHMLLLDVCLCYILM